MIAVVADRFGVSFRKVSDLTAYGLRKNGYKEVILANAFITYSIPFNSKTIMVGDTIHVVRSGWIDKFLQYTTKMVLWVDTPLSLEHIADQADRLSRDTCIYVVLPHQYKLYREYGFKVSGYIPRPVDIDTFDKVYNSCDCRDLHERYGDYILTISADQIIAPPKIPRKGLDMYDRLCEYVKQRYKLNCIAVSNWIWFKHVYRIGFGSLSEEELARLIKCARLYVWTSRAEGFGMSPLEAMALSQIVVSCDAPYNEHIVGIKFRYDTIEKVFMPEVNAYYYAYIYRFEDLREAVDYALSLSSDEREELGRKARENAKYYHPKYISRALMEV